MKGAACGIQEGRYVIAQATGGAGILPKTVYLATEDNPFARVLRDKSISNVPFYPESTMALFRANGLPTYQPWATPKETHPTARLRTESSPPKSV